MSSSTVSSPAAPPSDAGELPLLIGKYRVLKKLGEGATSEVFLCHDDFQDMDVAIKRVRSAALGDAQDNRFFERFFAAEAALVGRLKHPNVVQIFDAVPDPPGAPRTPAAPPAEPVAVRFNAPPAEWMEMRNEFFSVPKAKFYQELVMRHFLEVRTLINTNKRVATVWHRNGGPRLIRAGIQASFQPEQPLPVEFDGVRLSDRVMHIIEILKKYGSESLAQDIENHVKEWIDILTEGFSLRQLLDFFKQQEAAPAFTFSPSHAS